MKQFFYILLFTLAALPVAARGKYVINVSLPTNFGGGSAILRDMDILSLNNTMDSVAFKNNTFKFRGKCREQPFLALVTVRTADGKWHQGAPVIIEKGTISVIMGESRGAVTGGTPLNDVYYNNIELPWRLFRGESAAVSDERDRRIAAKTWTQEEEMSYMRIFHTDLAKDWSRKRVAYYNDHMNYPGVVGMQVMHDGIVRKPDISHFPPEYVAKIEKYWAESDARAQQYQREHAGEGQFPEVGVPPNVVVGQRFTDIESIRPDGSTVKLSELVRENRLTVLDFWASWCGPCRKEMPFMLELHNEFKERGVEIIGISTDVRTADWKRAMGQLEMPWTQILSREAGALYYVNSIPYTIIIDDDGVIVARRLRGEKLRERIEALIK